MEFRQLRYFAVAAKYLSFTDAAKQLYIAQSTLSQQIAELEKELGVQLFTRKGRSVRLTALGEILQEEANAIIARHDQAIKVVRQAAKGINGSLRIGFLSSPVRRFLPQLISKFHSLYPDVELKLSQINYFPLIKNLDADNLDFGILTAFNPDIFISKGYQSLKIFTDTQCVMLSRTHPLADRSKLKITDLAQERFIFLAPEVAPDAFSDVIHLLSESGITPEIVNECQRMEEVALLVESGIGITIVPHYVGTYSNSHNLRLINFDDAKTYDIMLVWKNANTNPLVPVFSNVLKDIISGGI